MSSRPLKVSATNCVQERRINENISALFKPWQSSTRNRRNFGKLDICVISCSDALHLFMIKSSNVANEFVCFEAKMECNFKLDTFNDFKLRLFLESWRRTTSLTWWHSSSESVSSFSQRPMICRTDKSPNVTGDRQVWLGFVRWTRR